MLQKEFFLSHDGLRIHAKLTKPEGDSLPLLVLIHGITGHMEEDHILGLANAVALDGIATLRLEMYGHGKSDGDFSEHTIGKWVHQVCAGIDYAASLPWVSRLYLAGHSQGGLTVLLAGALKQHKLSALLLLSPAINIWDGAGKGDFLGRPFDPANPPAILPMSEDHFVRETYLDVARFLPVEESIAAFQKRVLILHGDADESVPVKWATWAKERYHDALVKIIPGAKHCYDGLLEEMFKEVRGFLRECEEA